MHLEHFGRVLGRREVAKVAFVCGLPVDVAEKVGAVLALALAAADRFVKRFLAA